MPPPGYSPQYSFLPYYMTPPEDLLAPAKRASLLLLMIGLLALVAGGCGAGLISTMADADFTQAMSRAAQSNPEIAQISPQTMRSAFKAGLLVMAMCGVVAIILGVVVRGGSRVASFVAIAILALPILSLVWMIISSLLAGPAAAVMSMLVFGIPLALLILVVVCLVGAIRAAPHIEQARLHQHMLHQQQQAAYYAQAYGQPPVGAASEPLPPTQAPPNA